MQTIIRIEKTKDDKWKLSNRLLQRPEIYKTREEAMKRTLVILKLLGVKDKNEITS